MNHQSSHQEGTIRFFLILVFIAIPGTVALGQQTSARPDRGAMPGAAYQVSDIENISLQNGNVGLSIPLAALPPIAGGKLSWALSAHYNSKIWNMNRSENEVDTVNWHPFDVDMAQLSDLGGWQINGQYQITIRNAHEDYDYMTNIPSGSISYLDYQMRVNYSWYKVVLQMPDGSEHELRPTDYSPYPGSESFLKGYYSDCPYTQTAMRYYSFDGSHIYAKINNNAATWTVTMPDGTEIIQGTDAQRIQDTNGNKIKIFSDSNGTHYQDEQTGREIRYLYTASGNGGQGQGQVWYQTVGGTPEHIEINFGVTTVQGQDYLVNDWISGQINPHPCTHYTELNQQVPVVTSIVFPLTEPGQSQRSFSFSYNSDATESATNTVNWSCSGSGQSYTRTASKGWGSLNQLTTPSGAVIHYTYSQDTHHVPFPLTADSIPRESVTQKQLTHDGTIDTWSYAITDTACTVMNPDTSTITQTQYAHDMGYGWAYGKAGLTYRIQQPFTRIEKHWSDVVFTSAYLDSPTGPVNFNPVVDAEYTTLLDASGNALKMSAKTYQFDYNGDVIGETDYDWFDPALVTRDSNGVPTGVPGSATALRTTSNSYYNPATSSSSGNVYSKRSLSTGLPLILNALQQTTTGAATAQLSYDGYSYGTAPTVGNLTSKSAWDDVDSKWISTSQTYNSFGNPISATDARGKVTNFYYDDSTYALPNRVVVDPQNGTGTQTTTTDFDFYTGLVKHQTDANGNQSTIDYTNQLLTTVDPFGRPGIIKSPAVTVNGTSQQHRVTTTYVDHALQVISAADLYAENDQLLKTRATADMLGRPVLSEQTEDGTNYTIFAHKAYDTVNRIAYSSSPMRSGGALTDSWTRATSDASGRVIEVATFAGASQPPATGTTSVTGFTGTVTSAYDANFTTVTDQAGKQRRSMVDGAGRLVRVDEPDPSNSLGTTTAPAQPTSYDYDVFGNLRHVYQGSSQTRTFSYDSLSRLRSAINPESGEIRYTYDDNGNLATKTDARSIVSTYVYDALNRATSRSYSDSTPTVTYAYDSTTITNGKGRLASVSSSVSSYSYSGYDATGKPSGGSQTLGSQTYSVGYGYDLSGHVRLMTYPSGRVVNYNYDNAGRLGDKDSTHLAFTGNLGDATTRTYAKGITYGPGGQMTQEQFGTTTAVFNKLFYNSRSQLSEILSSTAGNDTSWNRGKIVNDYSDQCSGASCNGTNNNGNLIKQATYVPNDDQNTSPTSWYEQYGYDTLNRLTQMHEYTGNTSLDWQQQYSYDRYGNRSINGNSNATWGQGINNMQMAVVSSTTTNRMYAPGETESSHPTMNYDNAGNQTKDTYSGAAVTRTYDAENRMTSETQANTYLAGSYSYDGDGRRVKRIVGSTETWQIYGLDSELLAEYPANTAASSPQKEYGYRNGQMLITAEAPTATRTNYALASNGGTASASSIYSPGQGSGYSSVPAEAINGDRTGKVGGSTAWWNDGNQNSGPDWLQVDFNGSQTIDEIDLFTAQDNYQNPVAPTEAMTFTLYGLTGYEVQYWNGSSWADVTGGNVSGNNKVWRKFTFAAITTSKIRVLASASADGWSRVTEIEAWGSAAPPRTNVALTSQGGVATASSYYSDSYWGAYVPALVNNGDRKGAVGPGQPGGWNDAAPGNTFPDWLEIDFNGSKTIDEIDVITEQDNYSNPIEPTEAMTFSQMGLTGYEVQYWNGSSWVDVNGGNISGNNKVWRKITFAALTTNKIRVLTNASADGYCRIQELEAWTATAGSSSAQLHWLVTDQLGTPRMIFDRSGSLATMSRHDYLPFGEELFAGTGGRTQAQGYSASDGVRQHFTQKERDNETGLDYFGVRYFASTQGRFTSPDPFSITQMRQSAPNDEKTHSAFMQFIGDPRRWNRFAYAVNSPLVFTDKTGLDIMIIENGPTRPGNGNGLGNPLGHTAIAITGRGVFSMGNGLAETRRDNKHNILGGSVRDYLDRESPRRNTTIIIIKTTPEQDAAIEASLRQQAANKPMLKSDTAIGADNCSTRVNEALDAAGVAGAGDPAIPGSAGLRAKVDGGLGQVPTVIEIPKDQQQYQMTDLQAIQQFEPRNNSSIPPPGSPGGTPVITMPMKKKPEDE